MYVVKRTTGDYKWQVTSPNGHILPFGDSDFEDYTTLSTRDNLKPWECGPRTNAKKIRDLHILNYGRYNDWDDLTDFDTWERWLLWEEPTIQAAIPRMEREFNIKIKIIL